MKIGPHDLDRAVFIVAEVGNNHEGSYARAEEMIARAKEAGADAVKFQTIVPDRLVSAGDTARIAQLTRFQFSYAQFAGLAAVARREGITFLSTPFDIASVAALGCTIGYSDHTIGISAAILSVALGARVIEKHFTLDKNQSDFHDHKLSADPADLAELVRRVREAEILLGTGGKRILACEQAVRERVRRGIAAAHDLAPGTVLGRADLTWVRPRAGLAPGQEDRLIGRRLIVAVSRGAPILPEHCA